MNRRLLLLLVVLEWGCVWAVALWCTGPLRAAFSMHPDGAMALLQPSLRVGMELFFARAPELVSVAVRAGIGLSLWMVLSLFLRSILLGVLHGTEAERSAEGVLRGLRAVPYVVLGAMVRLCWLLLSVLCSWFLWRGIHTRCEQLSDARLAMWFAPTVCGLCLLAIYSVGSFFHDGWIVAVSSEKTSDRAFAHTRAWLRRKRFRVAGVWFLLALVGVVLAMLEGVVLSAAEFTGAFLFQGLATAARFALRTGWLRWVKFSLEAEN